MAFYQNKGNSSYKKSYRHISDYFRYNAKACAFFMDCDGYVIDVQKKDGVWLDNHGNQRTVEDILAEVEQYLIMDPYTQYYLGEIPSRWCSAEIQEFMDELREKMWLFGYKGFVMTADEHDSVTVEHTPNAFYPWKVNGNAMEAQEMLKEVLDWLKMEIYWTVSEL